MRWFGKTWEAPVNFEADHAETPVGMLCASDCGERIEADDRGVLLPTAFVLGEEGPMEVRQVEGEDYVECAYHIDCFLDTIIPDGSPHGGGIRAVVDVSRKP